MANVTSSEWPSRTGLTVFQLLASRARLRFAAEVDAGARIKGKVWIPGSGRIRVAYGALLDGLRAPIELHAGPDGSIEIGEDTVIEAGTSIEAIQRVTIGERVRIGRFCKILDNAFHDARHDRGGKPPSTPVVVEDEAILGERAILLPGAFIGMGAVVAPGTVVSRRVPAGHTASGVPAVVRRR